MISFLTVSEAELDPASAELIFKKHEISSRQDGNHDN